MDSLAYNVTQQEEDPFSDDDNNLGNYERDIIETALSYAFLITEIIKLILCICVVVFDIFLIYIICRFKKLQCRTNSYVMHYAIFNILYFVSTPIFNIIINLISYSRDVGIYMTIFCLIIQVESSCLLTSFLFAFGLGFDWLVMCFKPTIGTRISKYYKYSIWILYILGLIAFLVQSTFCFTDSPTTRHIISQVTYVLTLVFVIVLNILNAVKQNPNNDAKFSYSLTVANIIVFCWLPMYVYHHLLIFAQQKILFYILWFTEFIPEWIAYSNPIVIIFVLGRLNKYFKIAYLKVFKRSVASYSTNDDESDDEDDTQSNTHISYNNDISYI